MHVFERMFTYKNSNMSDQTYSAMIRTILDNLDLVKEGTIYDIADACFTSPTSISRLCKNLGYKGYSDFKADVVEMCDHFSFYNFVLPKEPSDDTDQLKNDISDIYEDVINEFRNIDNGLLDKLTEEIDRCNSMFYFDYLCNFEQLYALETNMAMAKKSIYYWSDMKQYELAMSLLDKDTLAVFLIPGIVQSSYMWAYVKKAIESEAKVVLLVQTRMNQTIPKEADLIIQFAGRGTQIDTIYTNILWKFIAVLFRKRYLRK